MQGLVLMLLFIWFLGLIGGGHARTGGLIHLVLVVALVMFLMGGL